MSCPYSGNAFCRSLEPGLLQRLCGGCRITVGGETKFACVDGPDFDGHQVDWNEAMARSRMFRPEEARAKEKLHTCRLTGGIRNA